MFDFIFIASFVNPDTGDLGVDSENATPECPSANATAAEPGAGFSELAFNEL